jgi:hypothetical protein
VLQNLVICRVVSHSTGTAGESPIQSRGIFLRIQEAITKNTEMLSEWYSGMMMFIIAIGLSVVSIAFSRRRLPPDFLRKHNEVIGPVHATLGVIYAVLLAFAVVVVWEQFTDADKAVAAEADALTALARDAWILPESERIEFNQAMIAYVDAVVSGRHSRSEIEHTPEAYVKLWNIVESYRPRTRAQSDWLDRTIDRLNRVDEARGLRRLYAESSVPSLMWGVLFVGGTLTIILVAAFGVDSQSVHLTASGALATMIALTLFLIAALDQPFRGVIQLDLEAFHHLMETLTQRMPQ